MKLTVLGDVTPTYVQTLFLLYFPGEHFPEDAENEDISAEVSVSYDGITASAEVTLSGFGKTEKAKSTQGAVEGYPLSDDRIKKLSIGKAVREAAGNFTGNKSPWGILTGVRPAKLATEILSLGFNKEETEKLLCDTYNLYPEKASLCTGVSICESRLVTPESQKECSIYIAIPFCPTRCAYCSFVSFTSPRLLSLIPEYLESLIRDVDFTFDNIEKLGMNVATVYIGGGTPTTLSANELEFLLTAVDKRLKKYNIREFTVEAGRPDTITAEKMAILHAHGVNRVSVNTQTLNDDILVAIGRSHTSEDFFRAYEQAYNAQIANINVDLIAGLPGEDAASSITTAKRIAELHPTNLTIHSFSVKKSARIRADNVYDSVGANAHKAVSGMHATVRESGYIPYYMYRQKNTVGNLENVGFALPEHECLYNIYMMEEIHSVFAVGASSVTKLVKYKNDGTRDIKRISEAKYPYEYLRAHSAENIAEHHNKIEKELSDFYG